MIESDIISLFGFTNKIRQTFKYLDSYMVRIEKWLRNNTFTKDQLERFMLIGFFHDYRGCVHRGDSLTTAIAGGAGKFFEKCKTFNEFTGYEIKNTQHYLTLLRMKESKSVNPSSLFSYVIDDMGIE